MGRRKQTPRRLGGGERGLRRRSSRGGVRKVPQRDSVVKNRNRGGSQEPKEGGDMRLGDAEGVNQIQRREHVPEAQKEREWQPQHDQKFGPTESAPPSTGPCTEAISPAALPPVPRKRKRSWGQTGTAPRAKPTSPCSSQPNLPCSSFGPALPGGAEVVSSSSSAAEEEGLSVDQTSRLKERVLEYVRKSLQRRDFVRGLQELIRIDPDSREEVRQLEGYVTSAIISLFDYRKYCANRDRDGTDKTLVHGIVLSGKGGEGRSVYLTLKNKFGLKVNFTRFVSKQKNARNQLLQRFGCFQKDSVTRMRFPPLLSNEEMLKIAAFREAVSESFDRGSMARTAQQISLVSSLKENPYDFPRRLADFQVPSFLALNSDAEYVHLWLSFLKDELRGEVHEFLTRYLPEIDHLWRVRRNRLLEPVRDIKYLMDVGSFACYPEGHEEVVLRPADVNSEYFEGGRRALHQDDVVAMRFVTTDSGDSATWSREDHEDEKNRTVLGFVEAAPRTRYEDKWKVLFFCPTTFRGSHELPRKVELQFLTGITPMRRMFEAVQEAAFISKRLLRTILRPEETYSAFREVKEYDRVTSFTFRAYAKEFNPEQMELCKQLVNQCIPHRERPIRSGFVCVQGPPGTGKTTAIISALNVIINPPYSRKVLLCAPSNAAVDLLIEKIVDGVATAEPSEGRELEMVTRSPSVVRLSTAECSEKIRSTNLEVLARDIAEFREYAGAIDREAEIRRAISRAKLKILRDEKLKIFCGTLGCLGQSILKRSDLGFDVVIVDEAGQSTEPEVLQALVPLSRSRKVPDVCVLVGDPHQLPATLRHVESQAEKQLLGRSLLQRLMDCRTHRQEDCIRLRLQYRMHPSISRFSAKYIYSGDLKDSQFVFTGAVFRKPYHCDALGRFGPVTFIDMRNCRSRESTRDFSKYNVGEIEVVIHLLRAFHLLHQKGEKQRITIAVISPYKEQVAALRTQLNEETELRNLDVTFSTIDGVQGDEVDLVIISTVRSNIRGNIGFVADPRRMNVALTRARYSLIIVGDSATLELEDIWGTLLSEVKNRSPVDNFYVEIPKVEKSLENLFPELYIQTEIAWK